MADKVIEIFEMTDGIMKSGMSEKERNAMGYLISETTKEEREKIVAESLGNIDAACDGCMSGLVEIGKLIYLGFHCFFGQVTI